MIRKHIAAKNFLSVGYDVPTKKLEIEFKNGVVTEFSNVKNPSAFLLNLCVNECNRIHIDLK